jgi:hypothetical protein
VPESEGMPPDSFTRLVDVIEARLRLNMEDDWDETSALGVDDLVREIAEKVVPEHEALLPIVTSDPKLLSLPVPPGWPGVRTVAIALREGVMEEACLEALRRIGVENPVSPWRLNLDEADL